MIRITRELLREWKACYSDKRIAELVPVDGLTPLQVLDTDCPTQDRLWVVLRETIIPTREMRLLACKWAREALTVAGDPDPRSVAAVDTAERYTRGEASMEELDAAWAAAWAAAGDAARAAAWDAAWDAAWAAAWAAAGAAARATARAAARAAAWAAARAAAWDAAWDAAWAAACAAAWDAAWDAQIEDCRVTLRSLP
jgi:hypothetical protein